MKTRDYDLITIAPQCATIPSTLVNSVDVHHIPLSTNKQTEEEGYLPLIVNNLLSVENDHINPPQDKKRLSYREMIKRYLQNKSNVHTFLQSSTPATPTILPTSIVQL